MPRLALRAVLATLLATTVLPATASAQHQQGLGPISAYPSPGTPSASPIAQISLRGAPAEQLGRIRVTGEKSGRHSGRLRAHSDGRGASFVLSFDVGSLDRTRTQDRNGAVLHEYGHVVDLALVPPGTNATLEAGIPRTGSCTNWAEG